MDSLWTDSTDLHLARKRYLTTSDIQEMLKNPALEFVIADVGHPLQWINSDQVFDCWKNELKPRLVNDPSRFEPEQFPGNYAYLASEWSGEYSMAVILWEKYH